MYQSLYHYISSKVNITDEEFEQVKKHHTPFNIKKKEFLLKKGEICTHGAFVCKGALRMYFINDKDEKVTLQFAIEDWWIGDRESFRHKTPSNYYIEAIETSELLLITAEGQQKSCDEIPAYRKLTNQIKEANAYATQKRLAAILTYTAEEKYKSFAAKYPEIIQRFPQHMIASYLGIQPETLSRLRNRGQ